MARKEPEHSVLVARHEDGDNAGEVIRTLRRRGFHVEEALLPPKGDAFPSLKDHAGVVVMGGMTSVNDPVMAANLEWMQDEILGPNIPALTICLGYQTMAKALGANVVSRVNHPEVGWKSKWANSFQMPLTPEGENDPVLAPISRKGSFGEVLLFHSDYVRPTDTSELIVMARGVNGEVEAIRQRMPDGTPGNALGVQWHPDATTRVDLQNFKEVFSGIVEGSKKTPNELIEEFRSNLLKRRLRGFQPAAGKRLMNSFVDNQLIPAIAGR